MSNDRIAHDHAIHPAWQMSSTAAAVAHTKAHIIPWYRHGNYGARRELPSCTTNDTRTWGHVSHIVDCFSSPWVTQVHPIVSFSKVGEDGGITNWEHNYHLSVCTNWEHIIFLSVQIENISSFCLYKLWTYHLSVCTNWERIIFLSVQIVNISSFCLYKLRTYHLSVCTNWEHSSSVCLSQSSGAVWKSRWPSWAPRPW